MSEIIGMKESVLDHGFVRVVDVMGDDKAIVQAARVSYGSGTKTVRQDKELISYLMRHQHMSPFEMCEIKLHVKCPIFVMRQWVRHRTANLNEISGRYSELPNEMLVFDEWRRQGSKNKQGSEGTVNEEIAKDLREQQEVIHRHARKVYEERLANGVAREQARVDLPLSQYTEFYWKIDLRNLLHFLKLRTDSHAQKEIRDYAEKIEMFVSNWVPWTYEAWCEHVKHAVVVSRTLWGSILGVIDSESRRNIVIMVERSGKKSKGEIREIKSLLGVE